MTRALIGMAAVLALGTGILAPVAFFAVVAVVLLIRFPYLAVCAVIAIEGSRLFLIGLGATSGALTQLVAASILVGLLGTALRGGKAAMIGLPGIVVLSLAIGPGLLIGLADLPSGQVVAALTLLLAPVAGFAAGVKADEVGRRWIRGVLVLIVVANVIAATYQLATGTAGLVASGLDYGTTVREIDGVLRAPGLTLTNSAAGLLGASAFVWFLVDLHRGQSRVLVNTTGLMAGGLLLFLSTSRSGLVLAGVTALVIVLAQRAPGAKASGRKLLAVVGVGGGALTAIYAFVSYGASSSFSLGERFIVWEARLQGGVPVFGRGIGSVGAASYSSSAVDPPVFVDNSWLSFMIQYGAIGLFVLLLCCLWAVVRCISAIRRGHGGGAAKLLGVVLGLMAVGLVVEIFDYSAAMTLLGCAAGIVFADSRARSREATGSPGVVDVSGRMP